MRPPQSVSCLLIAWMLCSPLVAAGQTGSTKRSTPTPKKAASAADQIVALTKEAQQYQTLLQNPDVASVPELSNAVKEKWIIATCQIEVLSLPASIMQNATFVDQLAAACSKRLHAQPSPTTASGMSSRKSSVAVTPLTVALPDVCSSLPSSVPQIPFVVTQAESGPIAMNAAKNIDRTKQTQLNANSSGGEINTKSVVWLGYINRLRYSASLGGVVTMIPPPTIPFGQIFPTTPAQKAAATPPPKPPSESPNTPLPPPPPPPSPEQERFELYSTCADEVLTTVQTFQSKLIAEEATLNNAKLNVTNLLNNLQPVVGTPSEALAAADMSIVPTDVAPAFPMAAVGNLQTSLTQFSKQYAQLKDWAAQEPENNAKYGEVSAEVSNLATVLAHYINSAVPGNSSSSGGGAKTKKADNGGSDGTQSNIAHSGDSSTEVADYEAGRLFVSAWREQFRKVAGARVAGTNQVYADYFIVDYKPVCGGFFGQGTSTQMQLTIVDSLNPTAKASPINLDKVICQPAISISSGLGLSFIPDQTPAFVPTVEKDAQGNPVVDSKGNPIIVQGLGYSSQANVRPAYALQVNASLWAPRQAGFEVHWSAGAMLTAATGGATTDIITGPTLSFRKRAIFISPMYDLGLRTTYLSGFNPGMPQGNLTSPPTHQVWKSGFGLTITFPFSTGTNTTDSTSSGKGSGTGAATDAGTGNVKK